MRRISCMLLKAAHRSALPLASSDVQALTAEIEASPPAPRTRACKTGLRVQGIGRDLPGRSGIRRGFVSPNGVQSVFFEASGCIPHLQQRHPRKGKPAVRRGRKATGLFF